MWGNYSLFLTKKKYLCTVFFFNGMFGMFNYFSLKARKIGYNLHHFGSKVKNYVCKTKVKKKHKIWYLENNVVFLFLGKSIFNAVTPSKNRIFTIGSIQFRFRIYVQCKSINHFNTLFSLDNFIYLFFPT